MWNKFFTHYLISYVEDQGRINIQFPLGESEDIKMLKRSRDVALVQR